MPHVILEREGLKIQADLSLADIKELMGVQPSNGHHTASPKNEQQPEPVPAPTLIAPASAEDSLNLFLRGISNRGRQFLDLLKENPAGIEAHDLSLRLGFPNPSAIGGLTGGGLAKAAKKTGVNLHRIYRKEITTPGGVRTVMFYPGRWIASEKPA